MRYDLMQERMTAMKTIRDKQLLVGADFAGYPLKEAVVAHLKAKGWTITASVPIPTPTIPI